MSKPHGYKKNIQIKLNSFGTERRQDWLDDISNHSGFQPIGISLRDIDTAFIKMVKDDIKIEAEILKNEETIKEPIPVIFLTAQRWSEFSRTWEFTDEMKEISLPFITIVRKPDVQVGTGQNGYYNIPGRQNWIYHKVPTLEGGRQGVDLYKIPQPTAVDVSFELRVFASKLGDLNLANEKILTMFDSIQKYIKVNGHPMPSKLIGNSDESTLNDFENRRMYINMYDILVQGYILDENEFEKVSTIDRGIIITEIKKDTK